MECKWKILSSGISRSASSLHCGFSADAVWALFGFYLPSALMNLLTLPLIYYFVRAVNKPFRVMGNEDFY